MFWAYGEALGSKLEAQGFGRDHEQNLLAPGAFIKGSL